MSGTGKGNRFAAYPHHVMAALRGGHPGQHDEIWMAGLDPAMELSESSCLAAGSNRDLAVFGEARPVQSRHDGTLHTGDFFFRDLEEAVL